MKPALEPVAPESSAPRSRIRIFRPRKKWATEIPDIPPPIMMASNIGRHVPFRDQRIGNSKPHKGVCSFTAAYACSTWNLAIPVTAPGKFEWNMPGERVFQHLCLVQSRERQLNVDFANQQCLIGERFK